MAQSGANDGAVTKRRDRFNRWRRGRPFAGGALLILASFVIAWIPINIAPDTIFIGKALSPVGLLFAALVFLSGIFALTRPQFADIFGVFGGAFAIISLYGALGGFGVGTVLGLLGANLCYAWRDDDTDSSGGGGSDDEGDDGGFSFDGESDDDSGGLFGTRSFDRFSSNGAVGRGAGGRTASVALFVLTAVVLAAFAQPIVAAAAQPFPEQTEIGGTVVVADEFSGNGYDHENVTTDTSNRERVSAGKLSFDSDVNIEGLTLYKNFQSTSGSSSLVISGSSASAAEGLSLTTSEAYFGRLGIGKDPVVVPAARNKWSTCPGEDFLLSVGDLGPLPGPPIDASTVVTNTHQLSASTIRIQDLELTMDSGTRSTSVQGTPECTRDPTESVLDAFTANALSLLTDNGVVDANVTSNNFTVEDVSAPTTVGQNESFDVSATVTNAGYIPDNATVEYRSDGSVVDQRTVQLDPDSSETVTFADTATESGTHDLAMVVGNSSAGTTVTVAAPNTTTATPTNATAASTTDENGTSVDSTLEDTATNASDVEPTGTTTDDSTTDSATTVVTETTTVETESTTETNGTETPTTDDTATESSVGSPPIAGGQWS